MESPGRADRIGDGNQGSESRLDAAAQQTAQTKPTQQGNGGLGDDGTRNDDIVHGHPTPPPLSELINSKVWVALDTNGANSTWVKVLV